MLIIGLAGGSGSGKGAVSRIFAAHGILPIDTDKVYHDLVQGPSPCLSELTELFGEKIISSSGALDRAKLGEIVFSDSEKLKILNTVSHRHILGKVREIIASAESEGYFAALVDAPLLFESGFDRECDVIISVLAQKDLRIKRICERDGITAESAKRRIEKQKSDEFLIAHSDFIIENSGTLGELAERVFATVKKLKSKG